MQPFLFYSNPLLLFVVYFKLDFFAFGVREDFFTIALFAGRGEKVFKKDLVV